MAKQHGQQSQQARPQAAQAQRPAAEAPKAAAPVAAEAPKAGMSDAKKAELKAKAKARVEALQAARKRVLEFVKANADDLGTVATDLVLVCGKPARSGGSREPSLNSTNAMRDLFIEKKVLTEMEIFQKFHVGRPEMSIKRRVFVQSAKPADRVWVNFDAEKGEYKLVATGPTAPAGWDGWVPPVEGAKAEAPAEAAK